LAVILCDVNVLVNAHRTESDRHAEYRAWLEQVIAGSIEYGFSDLVLSGFLRLVTNQRVYRRPTPADVALAVAVAVREGAGAVRIHEGRRHWEIFSRLCRETKATANLVPDAYFAALAIEHGCEWITADRGFARFPGLRWRHPLDG
jgi:toxin-antitoxin system PIN domain toxin